MKKILFFLFFSQTIFAVDLKFTNISGNTKYEISENQKMSTELDIGYRVNFYEPKHKKWSFYLSGILNPDYDHFGNEIKVNTFTALGIDF